MSVADSAKPADSADVSSRPLPPVEAPTGSFILQLFLIPLVIVTIVVLLWLMFSWMAHMGRDNPQAIIQQLRKFDDSSWQRAYELAELLRSPDPKYDELRRDPQLCRELAELLEADLAVTGKSASDPVRLKRRMFLCRAIGSFHVADGLPVLLTCAKDNGIESVDVQLSALEGIATLARNVGPDKLRTMQDVLPVVLAASREADDDSFVPPAGNSTASDGEAFYKPRGEVRAVAAYALGVLGGDEEIERLAMMAKAELYRNALYNAATGLARVGDERCLPVLEEMLQPDNPLAAKDERGMRDQDNKRVIVLRNGIQTAVIFSQKNKDADITALKKALQTIIDSDLAAIKTDRNKLKIAAKEALRELEKRK